MNRAANETSGQTANKTGVVAPIRRMTSPQTGEPARTPDDSPPSRTAIVVTHGMGQQLPFQEIQHAANTLRLGATGENWEVDSKTARQVALGDHSFPCLTMKFTKETADEGKETASVDIYESYWAPLAEGEVGLKEVVEFLYDAGKNGISFALSKRPFDRWMFGGIRKLSEQWPVNVWQFIAAMIIYAAIWFLIANVSGRWLPLVHVCFVAGLYALLTVILPKTARYLCFALMVVVSLVAMNATILAVAATLTLRGGTGPGAGGWPTAQVLENLTADLLTGGIVIVALLALGIGLPYLFWLKAKRVDLPDAARLPARLCVGLAFAALIGTALLTFLDSLPVATGINGYPPFTWALELTRWGGTPLRLIVWGGALAASRAVGNSYLVGYFGDVALYVSSHRLNRFVKARHEIRKAASDVTCGVYSAVRFAGDGGTLPLYDTVIIAAHSLGAVIAYDAYNAAVNQDLLAGGRWKVAERTRLMLTTGCPLDKVAFIFRSQGDAAGGVGVPREALAATVQPCLVDYKHRPQHWINVWSPDDWISGDLNYFDTPLSDTGVGGSGSEKRIVNLQDLQAWIPLASHGQYSRGQLMPEILFSAVVSATADDFRARVKLIEDRKAYDPEPPLYTPLRRAQHDLRLKSEAKACAAETPADGGRERPLS